jgi:hypothetical protein
VRLSSKPRTVRLSAFRPLAAAAAAWYSVPAVTLLVDLDQVLTAVRMFYDAGTFDYGVSWEYA